MKDNLTETQTDNILKALDDALAKGPWDESSFLRVIGKNLREIRDNLAKQMAQSNADLLSGNSKNTNRASLKNGHREVFIAVYSSDGNHLQSWERIIANLQRQMISRPIYADEENVKYLIKSKENKMNEAYVAISINEADILTLSADKTPMDKFGKPLMSLKDRSLILENINRFVHVTGTYNYLKGRLVKS